MMLTLAVALLALHTDPAWQTITVAKGCTVDIPKGMTEMKFDPGAPAKGFHYAGRAFIDGSATYSITIVSPTAPWDPTARTDKPLAEYVAGVCHSVQPAIIKYQRDVLMGGWPGLDNVILAHGESAICVRTFLIHGAIYSLGLGYGVDGGRPSTVDRFLGSLKVTSMADGGVAAPGPTFKQFEPAGGGFSIGMPSEPKEDDEKVANAGPQAVSHRYLAEYGNRQYIVGYIQLPQEVSKLSEDDQKKALGLLIDRAVSGLGAKAVAPAKAVSRGGVNFLSEECFTDDGINARMDATFSGSFAYSVLMVYPSGHSGSPDIEAFFDSFKFNNN